MSEYLIKPKTKRGEITLDKIIQAASEVFYEKGFHGGSISDITQRAGVGNGTFYIYFDSKLSVYRYLLVEYGKRIRAKSSQDIEGCASRKEAERIGIRSFFEFVLDDPVSFDAYVCTCYESKKWSGSFHQDLNTVTYRTYDFGSNIKSE